MRTLSFPRLCRAVGFVIGGIMLCLVGVSSTCAAETTPREEAVILTPKPPAEPRINGARAFGVRPGSPFLFTIAATGSRPMEFAVDGLPEGLKVDAANGQITGAIKQPGTYTVTFHARNAMGQAERKFKIVCGDTLALTPPMGWNDWYAHYDRISDKLMREAADAMVSSGMANVGYQYVNIDDCWMNAPRHKDPLRVGPLRDAQGNILPNKHFPDMKAMTDYIQIGYIGNAKTMGELTPCRMTPNEQYSFMSLWCLLAAPLIYSGDMNRLDDFTLNVLCNPEVIDVDQDPLGECARAIGENAETFVLVKNMKDGTKAVGLFNRGKLEATVTVKWTDLGIAGKQIVRDLWRQTDLGVFENQFSAPVGRHGVKMLRIRP